MGLQHKSVTDLNRPEQETDPVCWWVKCIPRLLLFCGMKKPLLGHTARQVQLSTVCMFVLLILAEWLLSWTMVLNWYQSSQQYHQYLRWSCQNALPEHWAGCLKDRTCMDFKKYHTVYILALYQKLYPWQNAYIPMPQHGTWWAVKHTAYPGWDPSVKPSTALFPSSVGVFPPQEITDFLLRAAQTFVHFSTAGTTPAGPCLRLVLGAVISTYSSTLKPHEFHRWKVDCTAYYCHAQDRAWAFSALASCCVGGCVPCVTEL